MNSKLFVSFCFVGLGGILGYNSFFNGGMLNSPLVPLNIQTKTTESKNHSSTFKNNIPIVILNKLPEKSELITNSNTTELPKVEENLVLKPLKEGTYQEIGLITEPERTEIFTRAEKVGIDKNIINSALEQFGAVKVRAIIARAESSKEEPVLQNSEKNSNDNKNESETEAFVESSILNKNVYSDLKNTLQQNPETQEQYQANRKANFLDYSQKVLDQSNVYTTVQIQSQPQGQPN